MTLLYTQFLVLQEAVNNRSPSPFYLPLSILLPVSLAVLVLLGLAGGNGSTSISLVSALRCLPGCTGEDALGMAATAPANTRCCRPRRGPSTTTSGAETFSHPLRGRG